MAAPVDPPVVSAVPKCPRCDYPVLGVEKRIGQPTIYRHAASVHEDLTADMTVTAATVEFIVEHQSDWYGDAEWFPVEAGRYPVRFTQQEAEAYIDQQIENDYQRQVAEYAKCKPDADRAREMHRKRKECLEAAGLGKQEWESFYPLVVHGVPCKEPVRMDRARFRVRTLSDWEADE